MSAHEVITLDYIQALHRRNVIRVPVDEITHMHADSKYVSIYHNGREILLRTPLSRIDEVLHTRFVKIHRNTLVNRKRILSFTPPRKKHVPLVTCLLKGSHHRCQSLGDKYQTSAQQRAW